MSELSKIIDQKFEVGMDYYMSGSESVVMSKTPLGIKYELLGLDSLQAPDSRCILSRNCLGSPLLRVNGIGIMSWGVEIPRLEGDKRSLEDLSLEAIFGHAFAVGTYDEKLEVIDIGGSLRPEWMSIDGLVLAISNMRVAKRIPCL